MDVPVYVPWIPFWASRCNPFYLIRNSKYLSCSVKVILVFPLPSFDVPFIFRHSTVLSFNLGNDPFSAWSNKRSNLLVIILLNDGSDEATNDDIGCALICRHWTNRLVGVCSTDGTRWSCFTAHCRQMRSAWTFVQYLLTYVYLSTYLLTYLLTPRIRTLLEKLTDSQLVKKFPAFCGTRKFLTAFTSARQLYLSRASSIQSIPPHSTSRRSSLILSSHLRLGLPSGLFPSGFPTKTLYTALPHTRYMPRPPHSYWFYHPNNIWFQATLVFLNQPNGVLSTKLKSNGDKASPFTSSTVNLSTQCSSWDTAYAFKTMSTHHSSVEFQFDNSWHGLKLLMLFAMTKDGPN
jgi:hypothetical protein